MFRTQAVYNFLLIMLFVEIVMLITLLIAIGIKRFFSYFSNKLSAHNQKKIADVFVQFMQYSKSSIPSEHYRRLKSTADLLPVMETFDKRFKESQWESLKNELCRLYLLPRARKLARSLFWIKRNLAARCFALAPSAKDEGHILSLLNDSHLLVRTVASLAAMRLKSHKGIYSILKNMGHETGYARFFYRDILLQGSSEVFAMIERIAASYKDPHLHLACLEVLNGKTSAAPLPFLHADIKSHNPKIRLAAVKVLAQNLQGSALEQLLECLDDTEATIRAAAVSGLIHFPTKKNITRLEKLLRDEAWIVRLGAAKALNMMPPEGPEVLKSQEAKRHKEAYAAAQYVLKFS